MLTVTDISDMVMTATDIRVHPRGPIRLSSPRRKFLNTEDLSCVYSLPARAAGSAPLSFPN
jgi:hypothetical protein